MTDTPLTPEQADTRCRWIAGREPADLAIQARLEARSFSEGQILLIMGVVRPALEQVQAEEARRVLDVRAATNALEMANDNVEGLRAQLADAREALREAGKILIGSFSDPAECHEAVQRWLALPAVLASGVKEGP